MIMNARTILKVLTFYARFTPNYTKIGYLARRPFWKASGPLRFAGQRWIVTGASAGLGKQMVHTAALAGAEVIAVARSQERLDAAMSELCSEAAARVTTVVADMSLQSSTQKLLDTLVTMATPFDVLMNNVGVLMNDHVLTSEGRESSYVTNVLSHFLLTEGLADKTCFNNGAVVVNMTSGGMYNAPLGTRGLNTTDPARYSSKVAYALHRRRGGGAPDDGHGACRDHRVGRAQ
jgi:dehydrogenase/reductase SDR family protein 12